MQTWRLKATRRTRKASQRLIIKTSPNKFQTSFAPERWGDREEDLITLESSRPKMAFESNFAGIKRKQASAHRTFWFLLLIKSVFKGSVQLIVLRGALTLTAYPFAPCLTFAFLSCWHHSPFGSPRDLSACTAVPVDACVLPLLWCAVSTRKSPHRLWNRATSSGSCKYAKSSSVTA